MQKSWILAENGDENKINELKAALDIPDVIANILINRNIDNFEEAQNFFEPSLNDLHDPYLMADMQQAVNRVQDALKNKESILVYGDYDVDGITSCSMLYLFLKEFTHLVSFFIPNRIKDGYGFSVRGVEEAKRNNVSLIITVDCGITAVNEVAMAKEAGIDVILTDHHKPGSVLPEAFAILNPMREDCEYPFKGLAGVGVAFKFLHALNDAIGRDVDYLIRYTDLVAIGSAADIVPLVGENRTLVREGINRINKRQNKGLNALLDVASLNNRTIGTGQILFGIAPRINAVGRLGSAERAVELFTTLDSIKVYQIARVLEDENKQRKSIEEHTFNEAYAAAAHEFDPKSTNPIVLAGDTWHPGVIGIVASRLVDKFYRPAVMIALDEGIGKGSIRSVPDFDVYSALLDCGEYLKEFGGHKYAAGLTIEKDNIEPFKEAFSKSVREKLKTDDLVPKLKIDGKITLDQIDDHFFSLLKQFAPFGMQNSRPIFLAEGVEILGFPAVVGKNHLKFSVRQNSKVLEAIGFNIGEKISVIEPGSVNHHITFIIEENTWRGVTNIQLQIKDIKRV